MFKNEYQGGAFVEIFSSQGKDPVARWKLCGSPAVQKVFDKEVKSYVYILEGSCQRNKMQLPKDNKQSLGLIQRFLVLQLCVPVGQDFSTELLITDLGNNKRRLYLSTIHKEFSATPLHAKIPLSIIKRKIWNNICIDMVSFTNAAFKGAGFQSLDRIVVSANCKLRKIFTMKLQPQDTTFEDDMYSLQCFSEGPTDIIPKCCQLGIDVDQVTHLLNVVKLRQGELRIGSQQCISSDLNQHSSRGTVSARSVRNQDISHIAFGSKVLGPPPAISKRVGTTASKDLPILLDNKTSKPSYQSCCNKEEISDKLTSRSERQVSNQPEPTKQINQEDICFTNQSTETATSGTFSPYHVSSEAKASEMPDISSFQMKTTCEINNSSKLHQSRSKPEDEVEDKWHFTDQSEDSFRFNFPHHSTPKPDHSRDNSCSEPKFSETRNENNLASLSEDDEKEDELKLKDIFTYSSQPRSAPRGKLQNISSQGIMWTVDMKDDGEQEMADESEAELEYDFHRNCSSEEEDSLNKITKQQPSGSMTNSEASPVNRLSQTSMVVPLEVTKRTASIDQSLKRTPALVKRDTEQFHDTFNPVQSRSPTRLEVPDSELISAKVKDDQFSQSRAMVKRSLKEIPKGDPRLTTETYGYDWLQYQPKEMSESDEARMLASLRRQQLEEMEDDGKTPHLNAVQLGDCAYGDDSISTSSDDTSIWSTQYTGPPVNQGHHYQNEMLLTLSQKKMNPLLLSNPRDWGNIFSPPIILPSEQMKDQKNISPRQPFPLQDLNNDTASVTEDQDEVLDLLYDPCLNCYFDPKTGKYYELA
ncbi:protein CFAP20DC isoform X2 [Mobula birostris]|uniref:protein CFAP20DC isoform X2 n=1 Tax=Mobula birostris TaxID=1983395 RepID=UPI003B28CD04